MNKLNIKPQRTKKVDILRPKFNLKGLYGLKFLTT